jgi:hypothetical protein
MGPTRQLLCCLGRAQIGRTGWHPPVALVPRVKIHHSDSAWSKRYCPPPSWKHRPTFSRCQLAAAWSQVGRRSYPSWGKPVITVSPRAFVYTGAQRRAFSEPMSSLLRWAERYVGRPVATGFWRRSSQSLPSRFDTKSGATSFHSSAGPPHSWNTVAAPPCVMCTRVVVCGTLFAIQRRRRCSHRCVRCARPRERSAKAACASRYGLPCPLGQCGQGPGRFLRSRATNPVLMGCGQGIGLVAISLFLDLFLE